MFDFLFLIGGRQDGQVNLPFKEEPFSPGFGDVTDKFGVTFQIYTKIER